MSESKTHPMPKPSPCPFCGCETELEVDADDPGYEEGGAWMSITLSGNHRKPGPFSRTADNGVVYDGEDFTPEQVIAAWNTRYKAEPEEPA